VAQDTKFSPAYREATFDLYLGLAAAG
jgi:hypothetical protein